MEAFREAREQFLSGLQPADKELFDNCDNPETLLIEIQKIEDRHRHHSNARKVVEKITPFVQHVEKYGKALDVFSNAKSGILCPIWGATRIILELVHQYAELYEKLVDELQDLGRKLGLFEVYGELYSGSPRLKESLLRAYSTFLTFCLETQKIVDDKAPKRGILRGTMQKARKTVRSSMKQNFLRTRSLLDKLVDEVQQEANVAEKEEASEHRREAKAHKTFEQHKDLFNWLDPVDPDSRLEDLLNGHEPGTSKWFPETPEFQNWTLQTTSGLWLHAKPGAGKSVMASTIVRYLRGQPSTECPVVYYFCDYKDQKSQSACKVMETLIASLCRSSQPVLEYVKDYSHRFRETRSTCSLEILCNLFKQCLALQKKTYVVIDAIDECTEREDLAKQLISLLGGPQPINLFLTSRELQDIVGSLESSLIQQYSLESKDVSEDISRYISNRLDDYTRSNTMKLRDPQLRGRIQDTLCSKADGMFQWVNCQIGALSKCISDKQILDRLGKLPSTLDETYIRALDDLRAEFPDEINMIREIFFWLVHSLRPLRLEELVHAVAFDHESKTIDLAAIPTVPEDITRYSGGLFEISKSNGTIGLAHFSVQEFLLSPRLKATKVPDFYAGEEQIKVRHLDTCFSVLCMRDFSNGQCLSMKSLRMRMEQFPLLKYAAQFWMKHYHLVENILDTEIEKRIVSFFTDEVYQANLLAWQQILEIEHPSWVLPFKAKNEWGRTGQEMVKVHLRNPIWYAAKYRLWRLTEMLIDKGYIVDGDDDSDDSPIAIAADYSGRDLGYLEKLINVGGNAQGGRIGGEVAHLFATKGNVEHWPLLKSLANHGADLNHRGPEYICGLPSILESIAANTADSVDMIEFLLGFDLDVNEPHIYYSDPEPPSGPPLQQACLYGNMKVAKLLLQRGADAEFSDCRLGSAPQAAARGQQFDILRMLLKHGCNLNATGGALGSLLQAAAWTGNNKIVTFLIDNSANLNAAGGVFGDALTAAIAEKHDDTVNLLLRHKAEFRGHDPDFRPEWLFEFDLTQYRPSNPCWVSSSSETSKAYFSPLNWAIHHGDLQKVERFVDLGIDLEHPEGQCAIRSLQIQHHPLCVAVAEAKEEIIDFLLLKGALASSSLPCILPQLVEMGNVGLFQRFANSVSDRDILSDVLIAALDFSENEDLTAAVIERVKHEGLELDKLGMLWEAVMEQDSLLKADFLLEKGLVFDVEYCSQAHSWTDETHSIQVNLAYAIDNGSQKVLERMLQSNISLEAPHSRIGTPLYAALNKHNIFLFRRLLEKGASPNTQTGFQHQCPNVLHHAVLEQDAEFLEVLLQHQVDVEALCDYCPSALWNAVRVENTEAIRSLISKGAKIFDMNHYGLTPVQWAGMTYHEDSYDTLLALLNQGHCPQASTELETSNACIVNSVRGLSKKILGFESGNERPTQLWSILGRCLYLGNDEQNALIAMEQSIRAGHFCEVCDSGGGGLHYLCKHGETLEMVICQSRCSVCFEGHCCQLRDAEHTGGHPVLQFSRDVYREIPKGMVDLDGFVTRVDWLRGLAEEWKFKTA